MIDFFFAIVAAGLNASAGTAGDEMSSAGAEAPVAEAPPPASVSIAPGSVRVGQGVLLEGAPATGPDGFDMSVVPAGLVAEPQVPSGKFTTAAEVKAILTATKGNWVAVRDYDGRDLLYVTHLWSWRCGLAAMAISVNDEPMQNWPLPPCHMEYATPNAILEGDGAPYLTLQQGGVRSVTLQIVYDDLTMDVARFERGDILIP